MNKTRLMLTTLAAFVITMAFATAAHAVSFRTHVSVGGNDANTATNCSRPNPCRNFAAAYGVTSAGGEIIALDSAGFGGVTITTAVTIMALPGQVALTNVTAGSTGITVSAGASDEVILKNIQFGGLNAANTIGVQHNSGKLIIQNCVFTALTKGVNTATKPVQIVDSDFYGNATGIHATGHGTDGGAEVSICLVLVRGGNIIGNTVGTQSDGAGLNANLNPLQNIWMFASTANLTNLVGNTANGACVKPVGQASACQVLPSTYTFGATMN